MNKWSSRFSGIGSHSAIRLRGIGDDFTPGTFQASDLQKGMTLKVDNPNGGLPMYEEPNDLSSSFVGVKPGELIGTVVDFGTGPDGAAISFHNANWSQNGWVQWYDLINNVSDAQLTAQKAAVTTMQSKQDNSWGVLQWGLLIGGVAVGAWVFNEAGILTFVKSKIAK